MVYRFADPARDWDAWCDDNDGPEFDSCEKQDYVSNCCGSEVNTTNKKNVHVCASCGLFCSIDEDASIAMFMDRMAEEQAEAKADAMMDW